MDKAIVVLSMEVHNLLLIEFTHLSVIEQLVLLRLNITFKFQPFLSAYSN